MKTLGSMLTLFLKHQKLLGWHLKWILSLNPGLYVGWNWTGSGHLDAVNCVSVHPNNNLLLTGSMDGTAKLWNTNSGKLIGTLLVGDKVSNLVLY